MFSDLSFTTDHPLDIVESIADYRDWHLDRVGDDEVCLCIDGSLADYRLRLYWRDDIISVGLSCFFGIKVPDLKRSEIRRLICSINAHLFWGRFDICSDSGSVLFCYGFLPDSNLDIRSSQLDWLIHSSLDICDRYFPAFQYVIWSGYDSQSALELCTFDVQGEA